MEGKVYLCSWKQQKGGFKLWVKSHPKIVGFGKSFDDAEEILWEKILDAFGDGENTHEFVPPRPSATDTLKLLDPRIVSVSGNTHSSIAGDPAALFSRGTCSACGKFLGKRNSRPLILDSVAAGYHAGFVWQKPFVFVSQAFRDLLTPAERSRFTWRSVQVQKPTRLPFYEIIPTSFIPFVPVKGLDFDLVCCDDCQALRSVHCFRKGSNIHHYLCFADIPQRVPSCFGAGWPHDFQLCFARERWLELVGKPETRGIVSCEVGVVDETWRDRKPPLKLLSVANREYEASQRAEKRALRQRMTPALKQFKRLIGRAKAGNVKAQFAAAEAYTHGLDEDIEGVVFKPNDKLASFWFGKAAAQGHSDSISYLANNLLFGIGVPQNTDLAVSWFERLSKRKPDLVTAEITRLILSGHEIVNPLRAHAGFVALAKRFGGKLANKWASSKK